MYDEKRAEKASEKLAGVALLFVCIFMLGGVSAFFMHIALDTGKELIFPFIIAWCVLGFYFYQKEEG